MDVAVTPRVVLLDPALTLETPLPLWLSTGIRALDHAVETLYAPGAHPVNDVLALEAIKKLFAALPACQSDPANLDTRLELQLAAWFSFFDEFNTRMGLSHNIGRRLGATYNIPHGITSCIALAPVMRLLAPVHTQALARIAGILNLPEARSGDDLDAARAAAGAVAVLVSRLGLPNRLGSFGVRTAQPSRLFWPGPPGPGKSGRKRRRYPRTGRIPGGRDALRENRDCERIGSLKHFSRRGGAAAARQKWTGAGYPIFRLRTERAT